MTDGTTDTNAQIDAEAQAATQALLRAIPVTRLIDLGMDVGSALRLTDSFGSGGQLDVLAESEADRLLDVVAQLAVAVRSPVRRAALAALIVAQLPFNNDSPRKRELYARIGRQLEALETENAGHYRNVEVPFGHSRLRGFLVAPDGVDRPKTVILFGGFNGWGAAYLSVAESLASVGLATLLIELPGQGTARMDAGLHGGPSSVAAVSACIDWIESESTLGDRAGVWGNSYGGLIAALAAASDSRVAAVCVNGAPSRPTVPPFRTLQELMFAFFGTESLEELTPILESINFADAELTIDCPLLVLQGGADPTVSFDDQRPFFDAGTAQRLWHEWPDGQHTMYNHSTERDAIVTGWFLTHL
jgi:alpha-beta hydrolase superfamily lysophospholipase